jgi:hypothetical protein
VPRKHSTAIYRDEDQELTLEELAGVSGVNTSLVERFVEYGLLEPRVVLGRALSFDASAVVRLGAICRIRRDFGANASSMGLILELVDRIADLEREVARLRASD